MPATYEFHLIQVSSIKVHPDRQRKELRGIKELKTSIERNGLLHPIIINRKNELVAGERRFRSFQELNIEKIPIHYLDELNPYEAKAVELEENIRRVDLTWKESALATAEYHRLRLEMDDKWEKKETAEVLGLTPSHTGVLLQVATEIKKGDKNVLAAGNLQAAINVVRRKIERVVRTQTAQIKSFSPKSVDAKEEEEEVITCDVFVANFIDWCKHYSGKRFNFVHCDFPFGVKYNKTGYSGSETWDKYDDDPDVYWNLLHALTENKDNIFYSSAHLVFWFSMNYYCETVNALKKAGFSVNPFPLIWHKDRGVIPDHQRGGRRVYETALFTSLGDRKVIKCQSNATYCPVKKDGHISTKPKPVLEHFFPMFVDELTEMLDPTCGAGSALVVAKEMNAKRVVGIDIEKAHVETSRLALKIRKE